MNYIGVSNEDIIWFCREPKTANDVRRAFNFKNTTVKSRLKRMTDAGLLERVQVETVSRGNPYLYQAKEYKPKEYKPLGMCVLGVWL